MLGNAGKEDRIAADKEDKSLCGGIARPLYSLFKIIVLARVLCFVDSKQQSRTVQGTFQSPSLCPIFTTYVC